MSKDPAEMESNEYSMLPIGKRHRGSMKSKNSDAEDYPILVNVSETAETDSGHRKLSSPQSEFGESKSFFGSTKSHSVGFGERMTRLWKSITNFSWKKDVEASAEARTFNIDSFSDPTNKYPRNAVKNQKYNAFNFLFIVLFNQFKFFFNLYFLLVALSQLFPALKVGILYTYFAPLGFVLTVTILKEFYDDYQRYKRDKEANSQIYERLTTSGFETIPSDMIKVGDVIRIQRNQRVPADVVLLHTTEKSGASFIRTDQLDGETDWKLRIAVPTFQKIDYEPTIFTMNASIYAEKPHKRIYEFVGTITSYVEGEQVVEPLSLDNTMWANTVVASGTVLGCVIYTGAETKAMLNTSSPATKVGKIDMELNTMAKILCACSLSMAFCLSSVNLFQSILTLNVLRYFVVFIRFIILFSSIIPISLRINLDMGRALFAYIINSDKQIPDTVMRNSNIPEEMGRVEYLLTDKTGTLTKNEMEMKKLHLGTICFGTETGDEVTNHLESVFEQQKQLAKGDSVNRRAKGRRDISHRTKEIIQALALCHNVTPLVEDGVITYQASSPDEVAIVKYTESIGLTLIYRDISVIHLRTRAGDVMEYEVLHIFPFTSELKRMGIVIRDKATREITFYQKGADSIMSAIVQYNDWLEEECGNMAREGLRTLVIGKKRLSEEALVEFERCYADAKLSLTNRKENMQQVITNLLESELELLGLTGVEDKLQDDVKITLEALRNAGLKIWMLTGDKVETATNIAISTKLISRTQSIYCIEKLSSYGHARDEIEVIRSKLDHCLVIDGQSLQYMTDHFKDDFIPISTLMPAVVCCRCSPTQKADVALLIKDYTKKTICCIGDGGNDVSMIQAASIGVGIVGKEGKQASLAADVSVNQFSFLTQLLLWHGRNSYKRSAKLSQFVFHRGLIIAVNQAIFSAIFYFAPISLYQGYLLMGYSTFYTMFPVFALVLDRDINETVAMMYPELYKDLVKGRSLSLKTFFIWFLISVFQGGLIMALSIELFPGEFRHIVGISFTSLVLNELIMVGVEVHRWNRVMILSQLLSVLFYILSLLILKTDIDPAFAFTITFWGRVTLITLASTTPLVIFKLLMRWISPPSSSKLTA